MLNNKIIAKQPWCSLWSMVILLTQVGCNLSQDRLAMQAPMVESVNDENALESSWVNLPEDLHRGVFDFLSSNDLARLRVTNRRNLEYVKRYERDGLTKLSSDVYKQILGYLTPMVEVLHNFAVEIHNRTEWNNLRLVNGEHQRRVEKYARIGEMVQRYNADRNGDVAARDVAEAGFFDDPEAPAVQWIAACTDHQLRNYFIRCFWRSDPNPEQRIAWLQRSPTILLVPEVLEVLDP